MKKDFMYWFVSEILILYPAFSFPLPVSAADMSLPGGESSSHAGASVQDIDISYRLHNVSNIAGILANSEENIENAVIIKMSQMFEQQIYCESKDVADYCIRIQKRITKLAKKVEILNHHQSTAPDDPKYFSTFPISGERRGGMDYSVSTSVEGGNTAAPATNVWDTSSLEKGIMHTLCPATTLSMNVTTQRPTSRDVDQLVLPEVQSIDNKHQLKAELDHLRITYKKQVEHFLVLGEQVVKVLGARTQIQRGNKSDRKEKLQFIMEVAKRVLRYIKICEAGYSPSNKSMDDLKVSLKLICEAHSVISKKISGLPQKQCHVQKVQQQQYHIRELRQHQPRDCEEQSPPLLNSLPKADHPMIDRGNLHVAHVGSSQPPPPLSQHLSDANLDDYLDLKPIPLQEYVAFDEIGSDSMNHSSPGSKYPINMPVLNPLASSPTYASHKPPVDLDSRSQRSNMLRGMEIHGGCTGNGENKVKRKRCTADKADLYDALLGVPEHKQHASSASDGQEHGTFESAIENQIPSILPPLCGASSLPINLEFTSDKSVGKFFGMEMPISPSDKEFGFSGSGFDHTEAILNDIAAHDVPVGSEMSTLGRFPLPRKRSCNSLFNSILSSSWSSSTTTTDPTSPVKGKTPDGTENHIDVYTLKELQDVLREDEELIGACEIDLHMTEENWESCVIRATYHDVFHAFILMVRIEANDTSALRLFPMDLSILAFEEYKEEDSFVNHFLHGEKEWPVSKNEIYKKVSMYSLSIIRSVFEGKFAVSSVQGLQIFLQWLTSYKKLFSASCVASSKLLYTDIYLASPLPPFGRTLEGEAVFPINGACSFVNYEI